VKWQGTKQQIAGVNVETLENVIESQYSFLGTDQEGLCVAEAYAIKSRPRDMLSRSQCRQKVQQS